MAFRLGINAAVGGIVAMGYVAGACAQRGPTISATVAAAEESVRFGMLEARFDISNEWLVSMAAAYLDPGPAADEAQLRLSAIGTLSVGGWVVENRHLFSFSSASVERYRMRVRIARPGLFGKDTVSVRAFDEIFFDFDGRRLFRNNLACGLGVPLNGALSGELYHVWEINRSRGDNAYVLAMLTFRFGDSSGK
jgi:hypothetical protein